MFTEDVFPGANATELWESMQHIYAQLGSEASVNGVKTDVWATSVKEAGSKLGVGDVSGAFAVLKSFGDEILNVEKVSGGSRSSSASSANIIPGMDNLVRVMNAIVEALRSRTSGAFLFKSHLRISVRAIRLTDAVFCSNSCRDIGARRQRRGGGDRMGASRVLLRLCRRGWCR